MTQRKIQYWVIPPEADAEFIAAMEDVLDTYEQPYDADYPVLCMDEQPVQLHKEIRKPIAATKRHARRVDYEYERCGTACIFMFTEPLSGWREVRVRDRRTKVDWAAKARELVGRLEFRYTPKHGSWLNIAENELSTMTRQCVTGRRFESTKPLRSETKAWASDSNKHQRGVDWQFNVQQARVKLKSLYPKIKS